MLSQLQGLVAVGGTRALEASVSGLLKDYTLGEDCWSGRLNLLGFALSRLAKLCKPSRGNRQSISIQAVPNFESSEEV